MKTALKKLMAAALILALCLELTPALAAPAPEAPARPLLEASAEGIDPVSALLAEEVDEAISPAEGTSVGEYGITGLTVEGDTAAVVYRAPAAVRLIVAAYAEQTEQMLACGMAEGTAGGDGTVAEVSVAGMPEYCVLKAYMVDPVSGEPLCGCFASSLYTRALRELEESTAEDYDPRLVLNLDEDLTTNFVVFKEGAVVAEYREGVNLAEDLGDGAYRIGSPDEAVRGLRPGDILALEGEDGMLLLLKVKTAAAEGDAVLLTEDETADLSDVFSAVKVEGGYVPPKEPADPEEPALMGEEDELEEGIPGREQLTLQIEAELRGGHDIFDEEAPSVTLRATGTADLSVFFKLRMKDEEKYVEASLSLDAGITFSVTGETGRQTVDLVEVPILITPVPFIRITVQPRIIFEASAGLSFHTAVHTSVGLVYTGGEFQNTSEKPSFTRFDVAIEGTVYLGFSLGPEIVVLTRKLGSVGVSAEFGLTVHMELKDVLADPTHACEVCLAGEAYVGLRVYVSAVLCGIVDAEKDLLNKIFAGFSIYHSHDFGDWGLGECPHKKYPVVMHVYDADRDPVPGAPIQVTGTTAAGKPYEKFFSTDGGGTAETALTEGTYTFYTTDAASDSAASKTVTVDHSKIVDLFLTQHVYPIRLKAVDEAGEPVLGAVVRGEGLDAQPVTTAGGIALFTVPAGLYDLTVSKEGYEPASVSCSVHDREVSVTVVLREPVYRVTVTVTDKDGAPISDARVRIGELDLTVFSNLRGVCSFDAKKGSYTLTGESADGKYTGYGVAAVEAEDTAVTLVLTNELPVVRVTLLDPQGQPVPDTAVGGTGLETDPVTDAMGVAVMQLEKGEYTLVVDADELYGMETVVVSRDTELTIVLAPTRMYWEFDEATGALRIWGAGRMPYYASADLPWKDLTVRSVTVEGLTSVAVGAFSYKRLLKTVTLSESVREIGDSAFGQCESLTGADLGSVEKIGAGAFTGCRSLTAAVIPDTVTELGEWAFSECYALTEATLSANLTQVSGSAFAGCKYLESIRIPEGVAAIGYQAFSGCTRLAEAELPESLKAIGGRAFYNCDSLESLRIPAGVTEIGELAFAGCYPLTEILVSEESERFSSAEGVLFSKDGTRLLCCPGGKVGEYAVPEGVTEIGDRALYECGRLTAVSIPVTVTSIGKEAFASCGKLTDVWYAGTRAQWAEVEQGMDAFSSRAAIHCSDDA